MLLTQYSQRLGAYVAASMMFVSVSTAAAQSATGVTTPRGRVTDAIIAGDLARFDSLVQRASTARSAAIIGLAREAYERNDASGLAALLLGQADKSMAVASLRTRRPDLWALVDSATQRRDLSDAARAQVVALETALIRANSPVLGAPSCAAWEERAAVIARSVRVPAPVVSAPPPAPTAVPSPAVVPVAPVTPKELRAVPSRVHFAYDKSVLASKSRAVLDALVDSLQAYPDVRIFLEGHTDPRGSAEYNVALSTRRVSAVYDYLISKGLSVSRFSTAALGKSKLETSSRALRDLARNRRVTLRYVGPDGREIPTVVQLDDLQVERRSSLVETDNGKRVRPGGSPR